MAHIGGGGEDRSGKIGDFDEKSREQEQQDQDDLTVGKMEQLRAFFLATIIRGKSSQAIDQKADRYEQGDSDKRGSASDQEIRLGESEEDEINTDDAEAGRDDESFQRGQDLALAENSQEQEIARHKNYRNYSGEKHYLRR